MGRINIQQRPNMPAVPGVRAPQRLAFIASRVYRSRMRLEGCTLARPCGSLALVVASAVSIACAGGTTRPVAPSDLSHSLLIPAVVGGAHAVASRSEEGCHHPPDLGVHFVGRVDGCDPRGARLQWSGAGFTARFRGTGLRVRLIDENNQFVVVLDGVLLPTLKVAPGDHWYVLATGLQNREHHLEFYRRTEALFGKTLIVQLAVDNAQGTAKQSLQPGVAPNRKIEMIGDSISCGYGNEGKSPCPFSADTENLHSTYEAVFARAVGAELSTVTWSGKGIAFNYGGNTVEPLPALYDRVVYEDQEHLWNFAWKPDLVIINLGTNDYSTSEAPPRGPWVASYVAFLQHIRAKYPGAFILCTIGPMLSGRGLAAARTNIAEVVQNRRAAGDAKIDFFEFATPNVSPGCDYHPGLTTHASMAAELRFKVQEVLGW